MRAPRTISSAPSATMIASRCQIAARSPTPIGTRKSPRVMPRSNGGTRVQRVVAVTRLAYQRRLADDRVGDREAELPEVSFHELDLELVLSGCQRSTCDVQRHAVALRHGHRMLRVDLAGADRLWI